MSKIVALYGGSFNPSTAAHRDIGLLIAEQIPVDEVWYLVSPQNPFKSREGMADFAHRVAMARLNLEGYEKLIVKDIEAQYALAKPFGVIETAETLHLLKKDFPDHHFVWTMGADNFVNFHQWGGVQYVLDNFPIVLIPRAGYMQAALHSPSAQSLPQLTSAADIHRNTGWYVLDGEGNDINATLCRAELVTGKTPECMRPAVAHYALSHKVYVPH